MTLARCRIALLTGLVGVGPGCKKQDDARPPEGEPKAAADGEASEPEAAAPAAAEEEESPYLDVSNFNDRVAEKLPEIVDCYKTTVATTSDAPTGRVKTTMVIDGDGRVKQVLFDPQRSTLKHEGLQKCIVEMTKRWRFNISLTGADTPMPYTFDLTADGLLKPK